MSNIVLDLGVPLHHHVDELVKVDGTVGVRVDVAHHVAQLLLGRVEAVRSHHLRRHI